MSKIICDICGTSYPETAKQCPICGCVRPGDVQRVTNEIKSDGAVSTGYTYVKGGRFSKSNVRRRTSTSAAKANATRASKQHQNKKNEDKGNQILFITAIVLFLAIIAVVISIAIRFFWPISNPGGPTTDPTNNPSGPQATNPACESITIDTETVIFEQVGEARLLYVTVSPSNTADVVTFRSENDVVATVSDAGKITAVGEGTTKIIITCGKIVKECNVICQFNNTEVTEPSSEPTVPQETLRLNRKDITFSFRGESWVLYNGSIAKNLITWSSDNEDIVTFVDGKAVAVGRGTTEVHAEYEGQKVSCIIRCSFQESGGVGGNGGVGEDGGNSTTGTDYFIYTQYGIANSNDISIVIGDKIYLYLRDSAGNKVDVTWTAKGSGITLSENTVTGVEKSEESSVTTTYNGVTYTCIIRVR